MSRNPRLTLQELDAVHDALCRVIAQHEYPSDSFYLPAAAAKLVRSANLKITGVIMDAERHTAPTTCQPDAYAHVDAPGQRYMFP